MKELLEAEARLKRGLKVFAAQAHSLTRRHSFPYETMADTFMTAAL